ncbi:MAG: MBL fold metallo-hydrolase [Deltaproteobacteria bacterium]|nr:MBL fold metallo-hydrolase [Deltaproteobacteria bacterium]
MLFRQLFDSESSTYTYLIADEETKAAALIDTVREQVERDLELLRDLGLELVYVLDTHVHADHVTGAAEIRARTGARTAVSKAAAVACSDIPVSDGDVLPLGKYAIRVLTTPGHTDGCVSYYVDGRVFTGDALLIRGTGRTDFQQGDARRLYHSVTQKLFKLPAETLVHPGHDYRGRMTSSIDEEMRLNPRLGGGKTENEFVQIMSELKLAPPKKIQEALPQNLVCGGRVVRPAKERAASFAAAAKPYQAGGILEVSPEAVRAYASKLGVRIVDVREPAEYTGELGHVEGSELIPLATVESALSSWPRDEPIVVICRSGGRSARATALLSSMGFTNVVNMAGGMLAYCALPNSATASR